MINTKDCGQKIVRSYLMSVKYLETLGVPIVIFLMRLQMSKIFFRSGYASAQSFESTVLLFTYEHQVPWIKPFYAALLGTTAELVGSALLIFGLGTRFVALMFLLMTFLIELTYPHKEHYYWILLLLLCLTHGGSTLSIDAALRHVLKPLVLPAK